MKTIRFTRNTIPEREGGPGYKAGDVATLRGDRAQRWIRRGAAVDVPEPVRAKKGDIAQTVAVSGGVSRSDLSAAAAAAREAVVSEIAAVAASKDPKKPEPTRDELLALAEATGVKVDGRWSDERLKEEIEKAAEATASKAKK